MATTPTLYLITTESATLADRELKPGTLVTGADREDIGASDPDAIGYYELSSNNSEYLEMDRIFPVLDASNLEFDKPWAAWRFDQAELGEPLMLSQAGTWTRLLEDGLRVKPKKKTHPSLLAWPAMLGHVDVVRVLLAAGVDVNAGNAFMSAVSFQQAETAKLLLESGAEPGDVVEAMRHYDNEGALKILAELGLG